MASDTQDELIRQARQARERAYAPYSGYRVGAAVRTAGGVFSGCNVENASYGLSICAERSAIFAAVGAGERRIEAIAVVTSSGQPGTPCGACRQVMHEFASSPEMPVILAGETGETEITTLADIFPRPFTLS